MSRLSCALDAGSLQLSKYSIDLDCTAKSMMAGQVFGVSQVDVFLAGGVGCAVRYCNRCPHWFATSNRALCPAYHVCC